MRGLEQFAEVRHLNLETYRKSGEGVRTPLWFVESGGKLYVRTPKTTGKVKRLRNNPRVRFAPCDRSGNPLGEWVEGEAGFVGDEAKAHEINERVKRKYGLLKRGMDLFNRLRGNRGNIATIELRPRP
jgi:PPOX class probable F420-dependent enzyme